MKYVLSLLLLLSALPALAQTETQTQLRLGDEAPAFTLPDQDGQLQSLGSYHGRIVILEWVNYDCPEVIKHYAEDRIQADQRWAASQGMIWLSVASEPAEGGAPSSGEVKTGSATNNSAARTVLVDSGNALARDYQIHRTPEFVIIDADGKIAYRGAADDKPGKNPADLKEAENYVRNALEALHNGKEPEPKKTTAYGCPLAEDASAPAG